ncbi:MAG: dTDP-4-dehydrorhamnose reductase [Desulfobacteraceae bacterium]|jgi:dTDP-4-dehydrorhamnose reductase|nr:MAG: dTDP-4-dehydrorhamnose reductase [Desulfobacteraceae bacterium]
MKILLCGGRGQLGTECNKVFGERHEVVSVGSAELDIADQEVVYNAVRRMRPHVIVNCAAFTKVDACEVERDAAWAVNVEGPRNLARAASIFEATFVHVSTDYVFDGKKKVPDPYYESDIPNPISYYGITKWEGEEAVRVECRNHMILRTAWLYGEKGGNFLKTMLRLALKGHAEAIRVVNDQFGSPTWAWRLALQMERLVTKSGRGTYHVTAEGWCTWYELAAYFLDRMKVPHRIIPIATSEYPSAATRPSNSILANRRLKEAGENIMEDWREDVKTFVDRSREILLREAAGGI